MFLFKSNLTQVYKRRYLICPTFKNDDTKSFLCWISNKSNDTDNKSLKFHHFCLKKNDDTDYFLCLKTENFPGWGRARNRLWSDRPRQVGPLIRPSQTEVTSDQTRMRSKIIVRSKFARSRLWSGEFQAEVTPDQISSRPLSRRVPDNCPD